MLAFRARPAALPELELGTWCRGGWRRRLGRRLALVARIPSRVLPARMVDEVAFWSGVRAAATPREWQRVTRSYVVLCYHRLLGEAIPGQERMDVSPAALSAQLRLLRLLGWRALTPSDMLHFHLDGLAVLPRRRFVLTADDGFAEAITELTHHRAHHPQVFAVTGAVGERAYWLGDAPVASWEALRRLQVVGALVGSHARRHVPLDTLDREAIDTELVSSLADLRAEVEVPIPVLAYPHGRNDARVRESARAAGYELAYTTAQGRNGAGTDRWALRRVEPKIWDSTLSFGWKVLTAESPPSAWERRLVNRWRRTRQPGGPG